MGSEVEFKHYSNCLDCGKGIAYSIRGFLYMETLHTSYKDVGEAIRASLCSLGKKEFDQDLEHTRSKL